MIAVTPLDPVPISADRISLMAAVTLTGKSKRTLWRRLSDGTLTRAPDDTHGRTMVLLAAVQGEAGFHLEEHDWYTLLAADGGSASAQLDMGYLFMAADQIPSAVYWLEQAARQQQPDAMLWLARLALEDDAESQNEEKAWVWLTKAAAQGHPIARAQLHQLKLLRG